MKKIVSTQKLYCDHKNQSARFASVCLIFCQTVENNGPLFKKKKNLDRDNSTHRVCDKYTRDELRARVQQLTVLRNTCYLVPIKWTQ